MNEHLLSVLVCPMCRRTLEFKNNELYCISDGVVFAVRNNIPVLLKMDARKTDVNKKEQESSYD